MSIFETGVYGYVEGRAEITNGFPVDKNGVAHIACVHCFYYSTTSQICNLNKERPFMPQKYVGQACPFNIESMYA